MAKIVLGVTGSIAAYKACELTRLFIRAGDEVRVVMTRAACEFVTPLTFRTLSRNPVGVDEFAAPADWRPGHVASADWADLVVVAPATANAIAKMRAGLADDLLTGTLLATRAPIVVAPAMNTGMWENPATQENIAALKARGVRFVAPRDAELACGVKGVGCLADPADVFAAARAAVSGEHRTGENAK